MTQKAAVGELIGLVVRMMAVKMVVAESSVVGAVNVDRDDMYKEMTWMK